MGQLPIYFFPMLFFVTIYKRVADWLSVRARIVDQRVGFDVDKPLTDWLCQSASRGLLLKLGL